MRVDEETAKANLARANKMWKVMIKNVDALASTRVQKFLEKDPNTLDDVEKIIRGLALKKTAKDRWDAMKENLSEVKAFLARSIETLDDVDKIFRHLATRKIHEDYMRTEMMNALRVQLKREPAKFNITNRLPATSVTSGKQYFFKLNVGDDDVAGPFI